MCINLSDIKKDKYNRGKTSAQNFIVLLKQIDYLAGPVLLKIAEIIQKIRLKRPSISYNDCTGQNISRILIIRPGGIGDAVLLIPSLKILKINMPDVQVDVLCEPRNRGIFIGLPWVDRILSYKNMKDMLYIAKNHYEIVFDTEQSHFLSAVFVSQFKNSLKAGFATNGRERVYDMAIQYHQNQYEMNSFFRLFKSGIKKWPDLLPWDPPFFSAMPDEKAKIDRLTQGITKPIACIFSGASIKQRHWPVKRWISLAEHLREKGFHVILLGGKAEHDIAFEIEYNTCYPVTNLCCRLSLSETAALFRKVTILISTDSGILHLGVLSGVPTISLFGPGISEKWGPKGKKHIILNKKLSCSPCTRFGETPPCSSGGKCMDAIKENDVVKAVSALMDSKIIEFDNYPI